MDILTPHLLHLYQHKLYWAIAGEQTQTQGQKAYRNSYISAANLSLESCKTRASLSPSLSALSVSCAQRCGHHVWRPINSPVEIQDKYPGLLISTAALKHKH